MLVGSRSFRTIKKVETLLRTGLVCFTFDLCGLVQILVCDINVWDAPEHLWREVVYWHAVFAAFVLIWLVWFTFGLVWFTFVLVRLTFGLGTFTFDLVGLSLGLLWFTQVRNKLFCERFCCC